MDEARLLQPVHLQLVVPALWSAAGSVRGGPLNVSASLGKPFQVLVFVLPGGVHVTDDALEGPGGAQPVAELAGLSIIIAGDELAMAALGEEFQAGATHLEIPRHDDHIACKPFPGAGEIA